MKKTIKRDILILLAIPFLGVALILLCSFGTIMFGIYYCLRLSFRFILRVMAMMGIRSSYMYKKMEAYSKMKAKKNFRRDTMQKAKSMWMKRKAEQREKRRVKAKIFNNKKVA